MKRYVLLAALCFAALRGVSETPAHVLVFTKTTGFHHESISSGMKMIHELAQVHHWVVTCTDDASLFEPGFLAGTDVVVFLNPSGNILNDKEREAFLKFIESGKGFVGIHAASDSERDSPWFVNLIGAHFKTHPASQKGTIVIEDTNHPAMKPFAGMKTYEVFDEWYSFTKNPRQQVRVLASLDERSLKESQHEEHWKMGDHPLVWCLEYKGSRSFYSGFGHTPEAFENPLLREHFAQAINWAARRTD
jgi:type 1 glutamine amidotransferase